MATATEQIMQSISGLEKKFDSRMTRTESAVDGLVKAVRVPAAAHGKTPEQYLTDMTRDLGGDGAALGDFGYQGRFTGSGRRLTKAILGADGRPVRHEPLNFNTYLKAIYDLEAHKSDNARKHLESLGVQRVVSDKTGDILQKTAMAESSGVLGGYTVPPDMATSIYMMVIEAAKVLKRAARVTMKTRTHQQPSLDQSTIYNSSGGQSNLIGGISLSWGAEAQLLAETFAQFRQTMLTAWQLGAFAVASNIVLQDEAVGLETLLTMLYTAALAWGVDYAFLRGNGVGKPLGMLNAAAAIQVDRTTGNVIKWTDVANMYAQLWWPQRRDPGLAWYAHPSVVPQLITMVDGAGRPVFIPGMGKGIQEAIPGDEESCGELLGIPVLITEKLPTLGNTGDLCLFDASKYLVGQRMELEIAVSPHVYFLNNQMVWRLLWRGDGQPWLNAPITLADGTYQVSPFVVLSAST
jgi:HK97 family phage major capsid protein